MRDAGLEAAGPPRRHHVLARVFIPLTRLCRDKCHYCTFATVPGKLRRAGHGMFMSPDEVLDIARTGAALGCKEALFTLGDKPEDRWPEAREWLDAHGYDDTLAYVRAMAIRVLEETGLLPHLNPGRDDLDGLPAAQAGRPVHGHDAGDDRDPAVVASPAARTTARPTRSRPSGCASWRTPGRSSVPFTTGHPHRHRRDATRSAPSRCSRCARCPAAYHGVQELIIQNFRAKPDTAMRGMPDAELDELVATVAVARHIMGPSAAHPGAAEPRRRRVRAAASAPGSTTGAASPR